MKTTALILLAILPAIFSIPIDEDVHAKMVQRARIQSVGRPDPAVGEFIFPF